MTRSIAVLATFAAACVPENIGVELPGAEAMASMIVVIESGGTIALEAAHVVNGAPDRTVIRTFEEGARVTVLYYREPLEVLGLRAVSIPLSTGNIGIRPLPRFDRAYRGAVQGRSFTPWDELDMLPPELTNVRIAVPEDACRPFEVVPVDLIPWAERSIAVSLEDGTALVTFHTEGRLFRVTTDGAGTELTAPPDFHVLDAYRAPDGTVWFSVNDRLIPWTEGQGFGEPFVERNGTELGIVDGSRGDAPLEIFTLTWDGQIYRFDGGRIERLAYATNTNGPFTLGAGQGLAWRAPDRAIAMVRESNEIFESFRTPAGEMDVTRTEWPLNTLGNYATVAELEGFGTVIASRRGFFYQRRAPGEEFVELPYPPFDSDDGISAINTLVAAPPRSFLFAGHFDFLVEFDREAGLCDPLDLNLGLDVRQIVPLGEDFLVVGKGVRIDGMSPARIVTAIIRRAR